MSSALAESPSLDFVRNGLIVRPDSGLILPRLARRKIPYACTELRNDGSYFWNLKRTKCDPERDSGNIDARVYLNALFQHGKLVDEPDFWCKVAGTRGNLWQGRCRIGNRVIGTGVDRYFITQSSALQEVAERALFWLLFESQLPRGQRVRMPLVIRAPPMHMTEVAPTRYIARATSDYVLGKSRKTYVLHAHETGSFIYAPGIRTPAIPKVELPLINCQVQVGLSQLQMQLSATPGKQLLPIGAFVVRTVTDFKASDELADYIRSVAAIFSRLPVISHQHTSAISQQLALRIVARMKRFDISQERMLILVEQFHTGAREVLDNRADRTVSHYGWPQPVQLQASIMIDLSMFAEKAFALRGTNYLPHTKIYCRALGQETMKQLRSAKWAFASSLADGISECVTKEIVQLKLKRRAA